MISYHRKANALTGVLIPGFSSWLGAVRPPVTLPPRPLLTPIIEARTRSMLGQRHFPELEANGSRFFLGVTAAVNSSPP